MDTCNNANVVVTLSSGKEYAFEPCMDGLYYFDTGEVQRSDKSKNELINYTLSQTVKENKNYYTVQEIKGADTSRYIQQYLQYTSTFILKHYINKNLINNCNITTDDMNRAELVYGPAVPYIQ